MRQALIVILLFPVTIFAQWDLSKKTLSNYDFVDVQVFTTDTVYAISQSKILGQSIMYYSYDGGTTYDSTVINEVVNSLSFINSKIGFAITESNKLFKTLNYYNSWTLINSALPCNQGIEFLNENIGWIIENNEFVYRTNDGGLSFQTQPGMCNFSVIPNQDFRRDSLMRIKIRNNTVSLSNFESYLFSRDTMSTQYMRQLHSFVHDHDAICTSLDSNFYLIGKSSFYPNLNFVYREQFSSPIIDDEYFEYNYNGRFNCIYVSDNLVEYYGVTNNQGESVILKRPTPNSSLFFQNSSESGNFSADSISKIYFSTIDFGAAIGENYLYLTHNGGGTVQDSIPVYNTTSKLNELALDDSFKLFPNPASNKVFINAPDVTFDIDVFSISGVRMGVFYNNEYIDLKTLDSGIYIVVFRLSTNKVVTKKIVVN